MLKGSITLSCENNNTFSYFVNEKSTNYSSCAAAKYLLTVHFDPYWERRCSNVYLWRTDVPHMQLYCQYVWCMSIYFTRAIQQELRNHFDWFLIFKLKSGPRFSTPLDLHNVDNIKSIEITTLFRRFEKNVQSHWQ